jgi:hypothetical protein
MEDLIMKKEELKIGQKVFVKPIGNATRGIKDNILNHIIETEIERIGNKYFYLKRFRNEKFSIEDGTDISSTFRVYLNLQDIKNDIESSEIFKDLYMFFSSHNHQGLSLEQLREIKNIVNRTMI